ncbi:MAG: hypothetical protein JO345_41360 [Streptosporangiaceae bacterium]|nr:hypothetical protein [Streptosporangiaceae bacterium]
MALFTYIQQNFKFSGVFYGFTAAAAVLLIASFFVGGRGAAKTANELAKGTWKTSTKIEAFNWQAILTLAGPLALIIATMPRRPPVPHGRETGTSPGLSA